MNASRDAGEGRLIFSKFMSRKSAAQTYAGLTNSGTKSFAHGIIHPDSRRIGLQFQ